MAGLAWAGGIARPRLVDRLLTARLALVEGPAGFGKSTLLHQAVAAADRVAVVIELDSLSDVEDSIAATARALRRAGLPGVAQALSPSDPDGATARIAEGFEGRPILWVIDDAHHATPASARWLRDTIRSMPPSTSVLVAGRHLDADLRSLATGSAVVIDAELLRFSRAELEQAVAAGLARVPTVAEVEAVDAATERWPAAVAVAVGQLAVGRTPAGGASGEAVVRRLVEGVLASATAEIRELWGRLGHLPLLSVEVAAVIGGSNALERAVGAGLPVQRRADGWLELAAPVRDVLAELATPTVQQFRQAAAEYARCGELGTAVHLLLRAREHDALCEVIAAQTHRALAALGAPALRLALEAVDDRVIAGHPDAIVQACRAAEGLDPELRATWLQRANRLAPGSGPHRRALDAERAREELRLSNLEASRALASRVLADAAPDELLTCARAHYVIGLATVVEETATGATAAARELGLAGQLFRLAGTPDWEATTLLTEGFGVHLPVGAFALAEERIAGALALLGGADRQRALVLTYHAEALAHLGRLDDAERAVAEANEIGRRLLDERVIGYAAWTAIEIATLRRDSAGVRTWMDQADRHPGDWFDGQAGVEYLCQCTDALLKIGEPTDALDRLQRAEARPSSSRDDFIRVARARYEALAGDAQAGLAALTGLERSVTLYPRDRWLLQVLRAACLHRLGRTSDAAAALGQSAVATAAMGDPGREARREPELMALAGEQVASPSQDTRTIRLLGGFSVAAGDHTDVTPAPGHPATLVKLLALSRVLTADVAIDVIWPDADPAVGRARLRNLLNRVRTSSGPVIVRHEDTLTLAQEVEVDVEWFEREATLAFAAPPGERAGLARRALQRYAGELLPGDRYDDWAAGPRERLSRWYVALLDVVADDALGAGDLDEALRLLDAAIVVEPFDERRYVKAARALIAQGRHHSAQDVARRAVAIAADLGVPPSDEVELLVASSTG